jgi:hypothetical protein
LILRPGTSLISTATSLRFRFPGEQSSNVP